MATNDQPVSDKDMSHTNVAGDGGRPTGPGDEAVPTEAVPTEEVPTEEAARPEVPVDETPPDSGDVAAPDSSDNAASDPGAGPAAENGTAERARDNGGAAAGPVAARPFAGLVAADPVAADPVAAGLVALPPARRRDPLWARLCVAFGAALILLSAGTVGAVKILTNRYEHTVTRDQLLAPEARETRAPERVNTITGPLNFLLIGSDFRARVPSAGQRSDTIIVVHVPRTMDRAYLVSVPRDLLVEIPPYGPTSFPGDRTKINAAFQFGGGGHGGTQLLSMTLTNLIDIRFKGAAIIRFEGFKRAVDVLGGVYMCVDHRVTSNHMGYDSTGKPLELWANEEGQLQGLPPGGKPVVYEEGCRTMNGPFALDYTRIRYGLPSGDYDRQRHQQEFLKAVMSEASKQGIATNPIKFDSFLRAVGSALTVDTGEVGLADLLFSLRNITASSFTGVTVPSYPDIIGGVSYILPEPSAASLYQAIREDTLDQWVAANPSWTNPL